MPEGVIAARQTGVGEATMAYASLPAGMVRASVGDVNLQQPGAVTTAIRKAVDEVVTGREKQLTLIVPDAAVRVLILDFDSLPAKAADALPILRFRLRKLMSFEIDEAAIGYQVMRQTKEQAKVLVTVMPGPVRAEYESAVRAAGYEPGVVLPATLASLAALNFEQAALVVRRNGLTLTTAITQGDELLLYRTLELPESDREHHDELARSLSVAEAYYEDTLQGAPSALYYVGPGGAEGLVNELHSGGMPVDQSPRVVDLVPVTVGALNAMPRGLSAGVIGALAQA
ncbi:hypothetical protein [Silvibacterium acidisoli]|uniref:hypothetical protein n=1 Tax=Acidobacteriaceae bacterium ZG23-2 TaxID=2883246 RepID=UPI00406D3483